MMTIEILRDGDLIIISNELDRDMQKYLGICVGENIDDISIYRISKEFKKQSWNGNKYMVYENNVPIGFAYTYDVQKKYLKCKIGYGIFKQYRRKGYGKILLNHFTAMLVQEGYNRLEAIVEEENRDGMKLLNNGMYIYEGFHYSYYGKNENVYRYAYVKI